jgi:hypothetical protein
MVIINKDYNLWNKRGITLMGNDLFGRELIATIEPDGGYALGWQYVNLVEKKGTVAALVQGSSSKPYKVVIEICQIKDDVWENIKKSCEDKIESPQELIDGKFPKALSELFTAKGSGLFPSPKEIALADKLIWFLRI